MNMFFGDDVVETVVRHYAEKLLKQLDGPLPEFDKWPIHQGVEILLRKMISYCRECCDQHSNESLASAVAVLFLSRDLYVRVINEPANQWYEFCHEFADFKPLEKEISQRMTDVLKRVTDSSVQLGLTVSDEPEWFHIFRGPMAGPDMDLPKSDYRIYLSPDPKMLPQVVERLALEMPSDVFFHLKTWQPESWRRLGFARFDNMVLYIDRENFKAVWQQCHKLVLSLPEAFSKSPTPPGGLHSVFPGVSAVRNDRKETGTQFTSGCLETFFKAAFREEIETAVKCSGHRGSSMLKEVLRHVTRGLVTTHVTSLRGAAHINSVLATLGGKPYAPKDFGIISEHASELDSILAETILTDVQGVVYNKMLPNPNAVWTEFQARAAKEIPGYDAESHKQEVQSNVIRFWKEAMSAIGLALVIAQGLAKGQSPDQAYVSFVSRHKGHWPQ